MPLSSASTLLLLVLLLQAPMTLSIPASMPNARCPAGEYLNSLSRMCDPCPTDCLLGKPGLAVCKSLGAECQPKAVYVTDIATSTTMLKPTGSTAVYDDTVTLTLSKQAIGATIAACLLIILAFLAVGLYCLKKKKLYQAIMDKRRRERERSIRQKIYCPRGPENAGPDEQFLVNRLDNTVWEATRPDNTGPEATRPDNTGLEATRPDSTGPEATRPDSTGLEATRPDSTGPEATRPDNTGPEAARPDINRPEAARPNNTGLEAARPDNTGVEATSLEASNRAPTSLPQSLEVSDEANARTDAVSDPGNNPGIPDL